MEKRHSIGKAWLQASAARVSAESARSAAVAPPRPLQPGAKQSLARQTRDTSCQGCTDFTCCLLHVEAPDPDLGLAHLQSCQAAGRAVTALCPLALAGPAGQRPLHEGLHSLGQRKRAGGEPNPQPVGLKLSNPPTEIEIAGRISHLHS